MLSSHVESRCEEVVNSESQYLQVHTWPDSLDFMWGDLDENYLTSVSALEIDLTWDVLYYTQN